MWNGLSNFEKVKNNLCDLQLIFIRYNAHCAKLRRSIIHMMMNKEATKIGFAYVGIVVAEDFQQDKKLCNFSLNMACGLIWV